jgi:hypothetical protein
LRPGRVVQKHSRLERVIQKYFRLGRVDQRKHPRDFRQRLLIGQRRAQHTEKDRLRIRTAEQELEQAELVDG